MSNRYQRSSTAILPVKKTRLCTALISRLEEGYSKQDFYSDVLAGAIVTLVAIPLAMALAIASGVPPQHGLYTVIIGGFAIALFGGSRLQVSGPTAAFVVVLFPVVQKFGLGGLLLSGFMAGLILMTMGFARMGRLIQFIPYPVTTGFTSGIAVVIAVLQVKDFFGLQIVELPQDFFSKLLELSKSLPSFSITEFGVGTMTLCILILWPKFNKKIPSPLVALSLVTIGCFFLSKLAPEFEVATIASRFTKGIPQSLPNFHWPWDVLNLTTQPIAVSLETIQSLVPSAFAIAMLGAIESLLSAVVADGMAQTKHDPDGELIALGIGNILCPFFGGIPATGAIARTTTNIRFGAKSPLSSMLHALFTLLTILLFAPFISYLPMAALAALLVLVAYNMSEYRHFLHILKVAPRSDVIVLLICFSLTVSFDMVVGVTVGIVLAALLFMRRMAEVTEGHKVISGQYLSSNFSEVPPELVVYEIEGALFFGAAEKAAEALTDITDDIKGVIFVLAKVSAMDITGLVALEGAINKLLKKGKKIYMVGLRDQPKELVKKTVMKLGSENVFLFDGIDEAISSATETIKST
ncbi:MAG: C4-dicarboxylic acid transporter DauA [Bdellovibrionales bacterium]|nr:C4-dicarboxylic acid transporter DauA [Bdellovibrionales bacterium]